MLPVAAPESPARPTVNKRELAELLRCSLPTVDALLVRHAERFPVLERGAIGREWRFEPDAVVAFLRQVDEERRAAREAREVELLQYTLPAAGLATNHPAEMSAKDRLTLLKAQQLERQIARESGQLVEVAALRQAFTAALARLNAELHSAIRQAARELNLPDTVIRRLLAIVAEHQRQLAKSLLPTSVDYRPMSLFDAPAETTEAA